MRRRGDSYVNATQILKVAGVDKGRRTKILEKEILPGKHEIVQGGYGKYQGTCNYVHSGLAPPPIMPGSALRLLNQGRAQGLFTPSTSSLAPQRSAVYSSTLSGGYAQSPLSGVSPTPPPSQQSLKRARSDTEVDFLSTQPGSRMRGASPPASNGISRPASTVSGSANGKPVNGTEHESVRFASKPSLFRTGDPSAPLRDVRRAAIVASIYQRDDPGAVLNMLREASSDNSSGHADIDIVLDDQGHTALHLAASMARLQTIESLINSGADVQRGNYSGETPLIRACIDTHNADQQSFHALVAALHPSIRTLDTSRKSVLHHIMSVAGIQGRIVCARYYLDQIFYWIANNQGGDFRSLVDLQDEHGDTALNIAARVGSRSLVRTLLDVGANRILPNKLGLRPGDFGVEVEELSGGPRAEDLLSSLRTGPSPPVQKSQDIISDMTAMIQGLSADFSTEIKTKQDSLDVTQAHLRAATRELSEQRKQIQLWQSRCGELDQVQQRIRNLEKALSDEDNFDWTGRTDLSGKNARESAGPAFQWRGHSSTMTGVGGSVDVSFSVETEPPIPTTDSVASLVRLRRLKIWHLRMQELMQARLKSLQGASAEKEYQCKKIVALCTGVPIDKVEDMLENLVIAVESEAQVVDIGRVSGFMQKVRQSLVRSR
ncbi:hypothetical protein SERLADRAFT_371837 [Serpula lacrymans var. lacrymans S7.9]|uniref:HTH APSES-type domain-containing protein n=1 Tax=Serpula lacrymans var. lacrymans (strain S7.9) TaxID=578457 RepID=F8P2J5_SERL9|nr:uncharacterized protein SERLADRAFT_371837 [Serpula lacrymans var. lacrymans S7.9]EGO22380.1 hypothetical protein SERLADRAFT_371837 [Serpula lacrymans var. lacrymans S7.9]